jgi:hypothetical protein
MKYIMISLAAMFILGSVATVDAGAASSNDGYYTYEVHKDIINSSIDSMDSNL